MQNRPKWKYNYFTSDFLVNPGRGYQECAGLELSKEFKRAVLAWIRNNGSKLTNGIESLRQNGVDNEE